LRAFRGSQDSGWVYVSRLGHYARFQQSAITTQRAADILGVSRPFLIKQFDAGLMAHHQVGNQRRDYLRDVPAFVKKRDQKRLATLDRLSRDAFEAGLYERNVFLK
jgi:excisionase family DNA binding protein